MGSPSLARLRHADYVEQCPSSGAKRKTYVLALSSSQFDPQQASRYARFSRVVHVAIYHDIENDIEFHGRSLPPPEIRLRCG